MGFYGFSWAVWVYRREGEIFSVLDDTWISFFVTRETQKEKINNVKSNKESIYILYIGWRLI